MSLVDQIFQQAQSGSAGGQGFGQFFLQGEQIGQEQQKINAELAQIPLRNTMLQQKAARDAAEVQKLLHDQEVQAQTKQAIADYAPLAAKAMQSNDIEDLQKAQGLWYGVLGKYPLAGEDAGFMKYPQLLGTSLTAKVEMEKNKEFNDPQAKVITDNAGNPVTMVQESRGTWKPLQQNSIEMTDPNGNTIRVLTGASGAPKTGLPPAVQSQLEQKLANTGKASALLDESLGLISPSNIGPVGKINAAVEKGRNILSPGSAPTPVTKAQTTFNTTAQAQYNALKADSQINKMEAAAIGKIANITDWWEAAQTAKEKYQTLRDLTGLQSVLTSHQLGRITPDEILKGMSLDFVNKYWEDNKTITDAELQRWIDLHGGNEAVKRMIQPAK